jgi:hypothetical protein
MGLHSVDEATPLVTFKRKKNKNYFNVALSETVPLSLIPEHTLVKYMWPRGWVVTFF